MSIDNCKRCDNLFHKSIKDICPSCVQKEEEDFKKVRMYIKRNKSIDMTVVSKETGVDLDVIYQFLQDGRLVLNNSAQSNYPCKNCGSLIFTGSLCENCSSEILNMQKTLQSASNDLAEAQNNQENNKKGAFHARD